MSNKTKSILLIILILLSDQLLKVYIKTHFQLGEEFVIGKNWFIIHFTENYGMAFGMEFGKETGKYLLTILRFFAVIGLGWYVAGLIRKGVPFGLVACFSMILAGAAGNLIDGAFYGMIFSDNLGGAATIFPAEGGYSSFLQGKVVDMFYFPLLVTRYPTWFPFWGGQEFIFFRHIFNIADAAVTTGVFFLFVFYRNFFDGSAKTSNTILATNDEQQD